MKLIAKARYFGKLIKKKTPPGPRPNCHPMLFNQHTALFFYWPSSVENDAGSEKSDKSLASNSSCDVTAGHSAGSVSGSISAGLNCPDSPTHFKREPSSDHEGSVERQPRSSAASLAAHDEDNTKRYVELCISNTLIMIMVYQWGLFLCHFRFEMGEFLHLITCI